jgi:hypothetical protein
MNTDSKSPTYTITALYGDRAAADRTAARLEAEGIPEASISMHGASDEGVNAEEKASSGPPNRFLAGIYDFLMPELDQRFYRTGMDRGGILLVIKDVPDSMEARVVGILDQEAQDIGEHAEGVERGETIPKEDTAINYSGAGSATGEFDRLTGKRIGGDQHPVAPADPAGSSAGHATGQYDRLTGERIGGRHRGEEPIQASETRPRRVRLYPM